MAVTAETTHIAPSSSAQSATGARTLQYLGRSIGLTLRAMAAGMRASKDYRLLSGMGREQLGALGLTRADIPREIHRRHFAQLQPFEGPTDARSEAALSGRSELAP